MRDPLSLNGRRERRSRQCPLPPGASSIDLEDSQSLVQPDHATSISASAVLVAAPWAPRSLCLLYTLATRASQVRPEVGAGQLPQHPEVGARHLSETDRPVRPLVLEESLVVD